MPRLRQNADRDTMKDFVADIKAQATRYGCTTQSAMGKALGLCQGSVGNYLREPETIRMGVLRNMCKTFKLDPIILLRALGYSSKDIKKSYMKEFEA